MADRLTEAERQAALPALDATGWVRPRGGTRSGRFGSSGISRKLGLHVPRRAGGRGDEPPSEWRNVYNTVDVTLSTHDAHGLTMLDVRLAQAMDAIAGAAKVQRDLTQPVLSLCQIRAQG